VTSYRHHRHDMRKGCDIIKKILMPPGSGPPTHDPYDAWRRHERDLTLGGAVPCFVRFRTVLCAALLTLGLTTVSAAADDHAACRDSTNEEAVTACSRMVDQNPSDGVLYYNRGIAYWSGAITTGRWSTSIR
jgi:hypothetical protein